MKRVTIKDYLLAVTFAVIIGCGGKIISKLPGVPGAPGVTAAFHHITAGQSGMHIFSAGSGIKQLALFQAPTPTPAPSSPLGQSFQARCKFTVDLNNTVPPNSLMPLVQDRGDDQNCNSSVGQGGVTPTSGSLVVDTGTVGTLVVIADTFTEHNLVCKDLTNTGEAADGELVSAWFETTTNTVRLFHNTTELPVNCALTVPAGDQVTRISVQYLKN